MITLLDQSEVTIQMTIWGDNCSNPKFKVGSIVGIKCA